MRPTIVSRVAVQLSLIAVVLVTGLFCSCLSTAWFLKSSGRVDSSHQLIHTLRALNSSIKGAESRQRGFLLTGGGEAYQGAPGEADRTLKGFAALGVGPSDPRRPLAAELTPLVKEKFAELDEAVRLFQAGEGGAALRLVKSGRGKGLMDRIEAAVGRAEAVERGRLAGQAGEAGFVRNVTVGLNLVCALVAFASLFGVHHLVKTESKVRERADAELTRARDAAEAADRTKGEFLGNISHEIRTPINAILGMTELTLDTDLAPGQRENLQVVRSATDSLLTLVDALLDSANLGSGTLELVRDEFVFRDHLRECLALPGSLARAKGLWFASHVGSEVPERVVGDPGRLHQVVVSLVDNAIKFTDRGEVNVEVLAEPRPGGGFGIHFRVTDSGIGIPPERLGAIFAAFTQADGSTTRRHGGTGLGLAISSRLVALMGGRIWVESEPGRGSVFHFTADLARSAVALPPAPGRDLRGVRVLVVDDDEGNRVALAETLTGWQMEPTVADGGRAALAHVERARAAGTPFLVVLVDALMPDVDGFAVAERIKAGPGGSGAVILMLTPSHRRRFTDSVRRKGLGTCLEKPIDRDELRAAVEEVVGRAARAGTARRPARGPAPRPLRVLLAEDNILNQRVATLILAKSGHTVTVAVNGREAVAALKRQPFDVVLMDLQMPEMDGLQATAAIRSAEAGTGRRVPILALTAHATKGDRDRCEEAGMDAFVNKPIHEDELLRAIGGCLSPAAAAGPTGAAPGGPVDIAAALARVDGDRRFLGEMAGMFLEESPLLRARIGAALAAGDFPGLVTPAHALKNWAGNFVAPAALGAVERVEALGRGGTAADAEAVRAALDREFVRLEQALASFNPEPTLPDLAGGLSVTVVHPGSPPCTL